MSFALGLAVVSMVFFYTCLFILGAYISYYVGRRFERAKDEKDRLDVVRRAVAARINSDITRLQRKYKKK